jgi:hypothetical protein
MRTAFIVPGRSPVWIHDQVRYEANRLTDDGRVLIAFTHRSDCGVRLPGQVGDSTVFGIAPNGYPLWTGRAAAALGLRRRHDSVVIVLFDRSVSALAIAAAAIAKVRREHVVVQDLRTNGAKRSALCRLGDRLLARIADGRVASPPGDGIAPTMLFGVCDDDPQLAHLLIAVASAMPAAAADRWRFVIQSDDPAVAAAAGQSPRDEIVSLVPGPIAEDLLMTSDVLVLRHGRHDEIASAASHRGVVVVIVGHPVAARVPQRFDGVRLASCDVSSMLVAIDSARGAVDQPPRSAPEVRSNGDRVVNVVRSAVRV